MRVLSTAVATGLWAVWASESQVDHGDEISTGRQVDQVSIPVAGPSDGSPLAEVVHPDPPTSRGVHGCKTRKEKGADINGHLLEARY